MPDVSSARAGVLSKRALVTASHAVERAALAEGTGADTVVFALFQRLPYFEREREVYARIARTAAVTVVGMVDSGRPDLPHGVTPVLLRPDESMAREWSVAVLSPTFGASVVAQDLDDVDPQARSVESLRHVAARLEALSPAAAGPVDAETGLATLAGITPWLGDATDTVPLGLVLVTVDDLTAVERRHGNRIRMHTEQNIADLLRDGLRPLDRAVRLGPGEFLVVQPVVGPDELTDRSLRLERRLAALHATYPFVDLHPRTTTMLTRRRPLPLNTLRSRLRHIPATTLWPPSQGSLPIAPRRPATRGGGWFR